MPYINILKDCRCEKFIEAIEDLSMDRTYVHEVFADFLEESGYWREALIQRICAKTELFFVDHEGRGDVICTRRPLRIHEYRRIITDDERIDIVPEYACNMTYKEALLAIKTFSKKTKFQGRLLLGSEYICALFQGLIITDLNEWVSNGRFSTTMGFWKPEHIDTFREKNLGMRIAIDIREYLRDNKKLFELLRT